MAHQVSEAGAVKHCNCSADLIDKKFSPQQVAQLNDGTATAKQVEDLKSEVAKACGKEK
ncbi:hypothetical protein D3C76_1788360 [compost metagenome]